MLTVPARFVSDPNEFGLDVLGRDGQPLHISHSSSNIPNPKNRMEHIFFNYRVSELPFGGVSGFQLRYRLVHTFIFRNVALKPIVRSTSTPQVTATTIEPQTTRATEPIETPFNRGQSSDVAMLPDGTQVRLISVGKADPYNRFVHPMWYPNGSPITSTAGTHHERAIYSILPQGNNRTATVLAFYLTATPWTKYKTGGLTIANERNGRADMKINVAKGPYEPLLSGSSSGASRRLPTGELVTLSPGSRFFQNGTFPGGKHVSITVVPLVVPARFISDPCGYTLETVGRDGRPVAVQNVSSGQPDPGHSVGHPFFEFRTAELEARHVTGFRFLYRPVYALRFHNVALRENGPAIHQPAVRASASLAASPTAQNSASTVAQANQAVSASNLHQIGLAIFHYAAAHDQHFPEAAHWMDQIIPYLVPSQITGAARRQRIVSLFHDPATPAGQTWSYAYNRTLSGLTNSQIDNPNQIVAVFETSRGVRNASDGGQSLPQPGRHSGGNIFLFADGHTKWLRAEATPLLFAKLNPPVIDSSGNLTHPEYTTDWFAPVNPASRQKIPIHGQVYNRRTMKPLSSTFVIFSQSPNKITVGSVWPSSFTNKAGRFQSILYPGKNYLMVLEDNRFRFAGKTLKYEANGNKGSISTQGTKVGPSRSAQSDYIVRWSLPQGYSMKVSSQGGIEGASITALMPIARSVSR